MKGRTVLGFAILWAIVRMCGVVQSAIASSASPADTVTVDSWALVVEANMVGLHDSSAMLGVRPDATPDFDSQYDHPSPPSPPGDWLEVYFPHTGGHWPILLGTRFSADFTSNDSAFWNMEVASSYDTGAVTLSWDTSSIARLPLGYEIYLKDAELGDTIAVRHQSAYKFYYSGTRAFSLWVVFNAATITPQAGWNLLSLPRRVADSSKAHLFPTASSSAFAYEGTYVVRTTLQMGTGFWLKYDAPDLVYVAGEVVLSDTLILNAGWNIVGALSQGIDVATLGSIPPAAVTSNFFGFSQSYFVATTLYPGFGYWVRVSQNCKLIFSASGATDPQSRIRISATEERPPQPPGREEAGSTGGQPRAVTLYQNYPNPFNPSTVIRYVLPDDARVRIVLINLLGRELAVLHDAADEAGEHAVTVDGAATHLASGTYFYRMSATGIADGTTVVAVKKLTLVK